MRFNQEVGISKARVALLQWKGLFQFSLNPPLGAACLCVRTARLVGGFQMLVCYRTFYQKDKQKHKERKSNPSNMPFKAYEDLLRKTKTKSVC